MIYIDIQKVLISKTDSIRTAIQKIEAASLRVALVVDSELYLLGVVCDGDIRRGVLAGISLDDSVDLIMKKTPITRPLDTPKEELIKDMHANNLLCIPLLNNNKLAGLSILHDEFMQRPQYQNPVLIMAGGFGVRLRPLTNTCPKPLLKIGDQPILEILINSLIKAGFVNFYISTHYKAEQIQSHFLDGSSLGINIQYLNEESPLGTGGALGLLPKDICHNLPCITINGDILTKVNFQQLLKFHVESDADATICVREYTHRIPFGVVYGENNKITRMIEKPTMSFFVNAGIYVVSQQIIRAVPKNHCIDMPTLLEKHMLDQGKIYMFPLHEYWLDIGQIDDFNRAQTDIDTM